MTREAAKSAGSGRCIQPSVPETTRMHAVLVGPYAFRNRGSGSALHFRQLAQSLSRSGASRVSVVTAEPGGDRSRFGDVDVLSVSLLRSAAAAVMPQGHRLSGSLVNAAETLIPCVVHAAGAFPYDLSGLRLSHRYPAVLSVLSLVRGELEVERQPQRIMRKVVVTGPSQRFCVSRFAHLIVQTEYMADLVRPMTVGKVHVVPEGIDVTRVLALGAQASGAAEPDVFIATGLRPVKGIDLLLSATARVVRDYPAFQLWVAGDGEDSGRLRSLADSLGVSENVRFLGFVSDEEEKYRLYASCKVVVVPSRWDNDPYAALDGATLGRPVVATAGARASVVRDNESGIVVPNEDVDALASAVVRLLGDAELRGRLGDRARRLALEYDWSHVAQKTSEVYAAAVEDFKRGHVFGLGCCVPPSDQAVGRDYENPHNRRRRVHRQPPL